MTQTKRICELEVGDVVVYFGCFRTVMLIDETRVHIGDTKLSHAITVGRRSQEKLAYLGNCKREKIELC